MKCPVLLHGRLTALHQRRCTNTTTVLFVPVTVNLCRVTRAFDSAREVATEYIVLKHPVVYM
jgi:hypothetical protein